MMMKSSPEFLMILTSGFAVIICSSAGSLLFVLYYRSPNALDKFKFPFTLPYETIPPAFVIRLSSISSSGLWSKLKGTTSLLTDATARESPELAQMILMGVIKTTLAVQPA